MRQHALRFSLMVWRDQDPVTTDVLLDVNVPFSGGGSSAYLEIDKLPDGLTSTSKISCPAERLVLKQRPRRCPIRCLAFSSLWLTTYPALLN